jgi:hypothetical protein
MHQNDKDNAHPRITIPWCPSRALAGPLGNCARFRVQDQFAATEDTVNRSPIEPIDAAFVKALASFRAAQRPCERHAAMWLAVAQRDLGTALASGPDELAGYDDVTDPAREYDAWVTRMTDAGQHARLSALSSVRDGRRYRAEHPEEERRLTFAEAHARHAAIKRAVAAIDAMVRGGPVGAAAREDVLHQWSEDDLTAEIRFAIAYSRAEA